MAGLMAYVRDSLTSLVANLGTSRDKAASVFYADPLIDDQQLLNAYRGAWLPRKIVDIPALDSCRAWRSWQAKQPQIEAIEAEEKRLNVLAKVLDARIKARLWGGAAIYIGTGDPMAAQPFDPQGVARGGIRSLTVLTRKDLTAGEIERDPESEWYGRPKVYTLSPVGSGGRIEIHPSRLVVFLGNQNPDESTSQVPGWGDSVLVPVMQAIKQADGTAANIASLVFEAKVNIIRIPDFMQNIGDPAYRAQIQERYSLAALTKGINGDLLLDKEEEFEQRQASFATLPDVMMSFMQLVSGAADIPATRLLGQSPAGMNATGESDLRNFYDRLAAAQAIEMTPAMARLDEAIIRSALGARDPDVFYNWNPLWQMSEKEKAEIASAKANATKVYFDIDAIPVDALAKAVVNQLIEDGTYPGLEAAIEESPKDPGEDLIEGREEERAAAEMAARSNVVPMRPAQRQAAKDSEPRPLYVHRKVRNGAAIIAWAKSQGFETTLKADDLHVTIAFSRDPVDWFKVGTSWVEELKVGAGGPRQMERFGAATVLLFTASDLVWRHDEIREAGASWDHAEYQPHITISYGDTRPLDDIEPYQGPIILGPEIFEEIDEDWQAKVTEDGGGPNADLPFDDAKWNRRDRRGRFAKAQEAKGFVASLQEVKDARGANGLSFHVVGRVSRPSEVSSAAGIDVRGFRHSVTNQGLQHSWRHHGPGSPEPAYRQVREADWDHIGDIVARPDTISPGRHFGALGEPRVTFRKKVGSTTYEYVAQVNKGRRRLDSVTFYRV